MSAPQKLRAKTAGRPASELTRLKELWRGLDDDTRAWWQALFISSSSQADIRKELLARLEINLRHDGQLDRFRKYVAAQEELDAQAERQEENTRRIRVEHPDWTLDQVREEVLRQSYFETLARGDFKTGLKAVSAHAKVEALQFDKEKFKESLRTKIQAGLDAILAEANNNPVIKAAVEQIQKATAKE